LIVVAEAGVAAERELLGEVSDAWDGCPACEMIYGFAYISDRIKLRTDAEVAAVLYSGRMRAAWASRIYRSAISSVADRMLVEGALTAAAVSEIIDRTLAADRDAWMEINDGALGPGGRSCEIALDHDHLLQALLGKTLKRRDMWASWPIRPPSGWCGTTSSSQSPSAHGLPAKPGIGGEGDRRGRREDSEDGEDSACGPIGRAMPGHASDQRWKWRCGRSAGRTDRPDAAPAVRGQPLLCPRGWNAGTSVEAAAAGMYRADRQL
jgi:hypothetical protein